MSPARPGRTSADRAAHNRCVDEPDATRILTRARAIPPGFVSAYGDLWPPAPRLAGRTLAACTQPEVPWHRVVRADGSLAVGDRQRRLLEDEGVPFRGSRVAMELARVPADALDDLARDHGPSG